jgi:hypothetical protein
MSHHAWRVFDARPMLAVRTRVPLEVVQAGACVAIGGPGSATPDCGRVGCALGVGAPRLTGGAAQPVLPWDVPSGTSDCSRASCLAAC